MAYHSTSKILAHLGSKSVGSPPVDVADTQEKPSCTPSLKATPRPAMAELLSQMLQPSSSKNPTPLE